MSNYQRDRLKLERRFVMFGNKKLKLQIEELQKELNIKREFFSYNEAKIKDDFNVLNEVLELKTSHYEDAVFIYKR